MRGIDAGCPSGEPRQTANGHGRRRWRERLAQPSLPTYLCSQAVATIPSTCVFRRNPRDDELSLSINTAGWLMPSVTE